MTRYFCSRSCANMRVYCKRLFLENLRKPWSLDYFGDISLLQPKNVGFTRIIHYTCHPADNVLCSLITVLVAFENSNCQDYVSEKYFINGLGWVKCKWAGPLKQLCGLLEKPRLLDPNWMLIKLSPFHNGTPGRVRMPSVHLIIFYRSPRLESSLLRARNYADFLSRIANDL